MLTSFVTFVFISLHSSHWKTFSRTPSCSQKPVSTLWCTKSARFPFDIASEGRATAQHVSCLIAAPNAKNLQNHALTKLQMKAWWEALCPVFVNCCPRVTHSKRTIVSTHLHWRVCVSCPQWCWHQCVPTYESLITPRGKGKHICLGSDTSNVTWRQEELHKRAGGDKNTTQFIDPKSGTGLMGNFNPVSITTGLLQLVPIKKIKSSLQSMKYIKNDAAVFHWD